MSFRHLKVGDRVTRMLGDVPMLMEVVEVKEDNVVCAAVGKEGKGLFMGGWEFNRDIGWEEDSFLHWGKAFGVTGSYLVEK